MIHTIKTWWHKVRRARTQWQYESGYGWAAGELLSGRFTVSALTDFICDKTAFKYEKHPFDEGVWQAICDWKAQLPWSVLLNKEELQK